MKSLEQWVAETTLESLPVLRRTALAVSRMARNSENLTATDISEIILHDPLMTLKVIGFVNFRSRGRFGASIVTAQGAVIMLGVPPFFDHFAALSTIEDTMQGREKEMNGLLNCLSRAHHAAWQARDLATLRADVKAEEVYVGALLHDMGEMVMWCAAPELMRKIIKAVRRDKITYEEAEKSILGFSLWEFQLALADAWKLPELLLTFMDNKNATNPRDLMAIICSALARHAATGWHSARLLADYEVIAGQFNFSTGEVIAIVHHNAVIAGRHWEAFHVPPAAAWLPMLPGEWPEEADDDEEPAKNEKPAGNDKPDEDEKLIKYKKPAEDEKPAAYKKPAEALTPVQAQAPQPAMTVVCLMPHPEELERVMDKIGAHLDGTLSLQDLISLALNGLREGIGLNRAAFALMTADHSTVKAKYVLGAEENSPLRNFQFDLKTQHLFARLLSKVQSVWVNASNQATLAPLIPSRISDMIGGSDGFFAMSVFVRGKPVGLFYADRRHSGCELDEHSYQDFKRLCLKVAQGLESLR